MTQSRPDRPTLTVEGGPLDGLAVPLSPGETVVVGSGPGVRLRLEHPEVAATHLKVGWDDLGVSVADAGSGRGTWLNGEPIEAAPLADGDAVQVADPVKRPTAPVLRVRLPKGLDDAATHEPLEPSHAPSRPAARPLPSAPTAPSLTRAAAGRPDLVRLGLVAGSVAILVAGGLVAKRLFFSAPYLGSVQPAAAEPGQTLTLTGSRFGAEAAAITVWFGDVPVSADASASDSLQVKVPATSTAGEVALFVETTSGRSRRTPFRVLPLLRSLEIDPEGALPGDEVVLKGQGFASGVVVSVGAVAAEVLSVEPQAVRFRVPPVAAVPASRLPVVATVDGRSTPPFPFVLARVPLVESADPPRAAAGEVVRLKGVGFAADPDANLVTFDGAGALVVAASPSELAVVAPVSTSPAAETLARLVVQARGRASEPRGYPLLRLTEGAWVPRCIAQPLGDGAARAQVVVGTEVGPLLMLSSRDEARSRPLRAIAACAQLDAALNRARAGERVSFEARAHPSGGVGVGVVGRADMVERVTPQDAAAYERPPGVAPRREPPSPAEVARLWAALLNDLVAVTTSAGAPAAVADLSPPAGRAFAELRAALPWQYGVGVSSARVAALSAETRRRLREAALVVP